MTTLQYDGRAYRTDSDAMRVEYCPDSDAMRVEYCPDSDAMRVEYWSESARRWIRTFSWRERNEHRYVATL